LTGVFIALLLCLVCSAPAAAKLSAEIRADEAGLYVDYDLWILGKNQTTLTPGSQPLVVPVLGMATIEISVLEIQTDNKMIKIHAQASAPAFGIPGVEADLPLPFGDYGLYYSMFERRFIPLENHKIEISALLTRLSTQYDVNIDLAPVFSLQWTGTNNPINNTFHQTVENPLDGSTYDITAVLDYKSMYFTNVTLTITKNGVPTGAIPPFPLPNGTYHIWADFELPEQL
jgi:hypothetical protein